jgi:hypothetical protein
MRASIALLAGVVALATKAASMSSEPGTYFVEIRRTCSTCDPEAGIRVPVPRSRCRAC